MSTTVTASDAYTNNRSGKDELRRRTDHRFVDVGRQNPIKL
jgi:hypothetical protein